MKRRLKKFWKNNHEVILGSAAIIAVCLVMTVAEIPICPIKIFFGIPCAGCGISRALISVCFLDFAAAFEYNPAWPLVLITVVAEILLMFFDKIKAAKIVGIGFLVIISAIYIYRVAFTDSPIVAWDFESGLLYRAYEWLVNLF